MAATRKLTSETRVHEPNKDSDYHIGLRLRTQIIADQGAEYGRPWAAARSMSLKTPCIRAWVVTPNSIALGGRLRHRAW